MTKKINWRLSKLPTPDEVRELVKDKILTQEEAREILFTQEDEEERDKKSLENEIKFLRELINKLSNRTQIVETIREIEKPYHAWHWYKPYMYYCTPQSGTASGNSLNLMNASYTSITGSGDFTQIKTF